MRNILLIGIIVLLAGCGKKYPIPPEPTTGDLPPLGSYVRDVNWPGSSISFNNVKDVIVGKDGFIYVLDGETVYRLLITGEVVGQINVPPNMEAMAQDHMRNLYFVGIDSNLYRYSRNGDRETLRVPDSLMNLTGITVGERIIVSDTLKDLVISFLPDSVIDTVAVFGSGALFVDNPLDIWLDPLNRVLTVSYNHNWVEAFPLDSLHPFLHLGGDNPQGDTVEGTFRMPVDVVSDDSGYIYIADSFRVQKFDFAGNYVTEVRFDDLSPVSVAVTDDGKYLIVGFKNLLYKFERFDGLQQGGGG